MAPAHVPPPTEEGLEQTDKVRIAIRQLERSEDYLAAAVNLKLEDPRANRALHELRAGVLDLRSYLARPAGLR